METSGLTGRFFQVCEWVMRFAFLQFLWLIFTLLGFILFGLMPATAAMFSVARKWVRGEGDSPIYKTFWREYRAGFVQTNLLGLILAAIGIIIYIDLLLLPAEGLLLQMVRYGVLVLGVVYLIILIFVFPVYVHYRLELFQYLKISMITGLSNPHVSVSILASVFCVYYLFLLIPGFIPFFFASVLSFIWMWLANLAFSRTEERETLKAKSTILNNQQVMKRSLF